MDLNVMKKQLEDGQMQLQQQLNNVRADLAELDQTRMNIEARILSQRGALALIAKLMEPEQTYQEEEITNG